MSRMVKLIVIMMVLFMCQAPAMASEVDILVRKLVEHGVLSKKDATDILKKTRIEADKERQETIAATRKAVMTGEDAKIMIAEALPSWIKDTKFKGDFRLRWEYKNRENNKRNRNRGRYRLRLGFVTKINEKVDVGFGLATGSSGGRSTNQTMNNSFDSPDVRLDYAYASYKPTDWLKLTGGKFKNPIWRANSWLWDSDIRPEGAVMQMKHTTKGGVELFMTNGFFIIDEYSSNSDDPMMFVVQPGYKVKLGKAAYFKNAISYYNFQDVKGNALDDSSESNTLDGAGNLKYDYDAIVVSAELGTKTDSALIPFVKLFGEYVQNVQVGKKDEGWMGGIQFGHKKVKKPRQWKVKAYYQRLERDAWLDILPDADAYSGKTDTESYVVKAEYGLMKRVSFGTAYYYSTNLHGDKDREDLFQADLKFKF